MTTLDWLPTPVGIDSPQWITRPGCRVVLAVVHTIASCLRILDVIDQLESDPRLQIVFTVAPDVFNHSLPAHLRDLGALVLPWSQACRERFDLAVAAAYGGLSELHAPLMVMAHGAGHGKLVRPMPGRPPAERAVYGLDAQRLTRNGAVLPAAVLLACETERETLRRQCPVALDVATVVGDPCYDRLVASLPRRPRYRRALGLGDGQELVIVSSTWGPDGLYGRVPDLLPRLMDQLPAQRFRVAALLHPAVWEAHGRRQIRAWTHDCRRAGLLLPEPADDWRAYVIAADHVIGDHGSVTAYAAAIGRPVLHLAPAGVLAAGSAQSVVTSGPGRLEPAAPLLPQLRATGRRPTGRAEPSACAADPAVTTALTSRPGRALPLIRRIAYRILGLPEPGRHRAPTPVPVPAPSPVSVRHRCRR